MAEFNLHIAGNLDELSEIAARLSGVGPGPAIADAAGLSAVIDKPKRAARKGDKPEEGSTTDATAASPATEAPTPITQQTEAQTKLVDPDVAAAQNAGDTRKEPVTTTIVDPGVTIVEGGQPTAGAPGEVTLDMLKDELGKLLKKEGFGAKAAQDLIRQHGKGAPGLSQAAATDYAAIHTALVAANLG